MALHREGQPTREMKPLKDLSTAEQAQIHGLDKNADLIAQKRNRMAELLRSIRDFYPRKKVMVDGHEKIIVDHLSLHELSKLTTEEALLKLDLSKLDEDARDTKFIQLDELLELQRDLEQSGGLKSADAKTKNTDVYEFYRARFGDLAFAAKEIQAFQDQLAILDAKYNRVTTARRAPGEKFDPQTHARLLKKIREDYTTIEKKLSDYITESPESYLAMNMLYLSELRQHFDTNGRIVETPYVMQMKARVRGIIGQGRAVFVHGELGAGKTEFAKDLARDIWLEKNPSPVLPPEFSTEEDLDVRRQMRKDWGLKLDAWKALRDQDWNGPIIYGRKGIESDEIMGSRKIQRADTISPEEQVTRIDAGWKVMRDEMKQTNPEKKDVDALRDVYEKAMLESFRAPVETANFLGPLMKAMKEGRVLIIDELNAIPHHVLIAMNDMLLRRPGETVHPPIPGEPPFQVAEGFAVIATGNFKPEDGKIYVGRQQLDAAFLSRFGIVNYDYLPMPTDTAPDRADVERLREYRHKSEQSMMFALRLLNTDLTMNVPKTAFGPHGHIERLARVARQLQDIFSAPEGTKFYRDVGGTRTDMKTTLKENVLSIRHVIPIIESWRNEGFSHDFNEYLFLNYVANSSARPTEMLLIYAELQVQGNFFPTSKGWPDATDPDASKKILNYAINDKLFPMNPKTKRRTLAAPDASTDPIEHFSTNEVVGWLMGPVPERTAVSNKFIDRASRFASARTEKDKRVERAERLKNVGGIKGLFSNPDVLEHMDGKFIR